MLQTRLKSGLQPCPTCCMHQALPACGRWSQQASQQQHRSSSANCPSHPASSRRQRRQRGSLLISAAVKITTDKNVVCSKTLVGIPGQEKTLFRLCKDITKFSQQRMSDRQSGILSFECSQDNWDPNVVHFWERYVGNAKLGAHSTSPEMQKFMEKVQPFLQQPIGMALYEWKDGKIGAVCMQGGPKGEGGLDDATGASGAAGGAGLKQTSATVDLGLTKEDAKEEDRGLWGLNIKFPWMKKK